MKPPASLRELPPEVQEFLSLLQSTWTHLDWRPESNYVHPDAFFYGAPLGPLKIQGYARALALINHPDSGVYWTRTESVVNVFADSGDMRAIDQERTQELRPREGIADLARLDPEASLMAAKKTMDRLKRWRQVAPPLDALYPSPPPSVSDLKSRHREIYLNTLSNHPWAPLQHLVGCFQEDAHSTCQSTLRMGRALLPQWQWRPASPLQPEPVTPGEGGPAWTPQAEANLPSERFRVRVSSQGLVEAAGRGSLTMKVRWRLYDSFPPGGGPPRRLIQAIGHLPVHRLPEGILISTQLRVLADFMRRWRRVADYGHLLPDTL